YLCSCNAPLSALLESLDHRHREHSDQLSEMECIHAKAIRAGEYDQPKGEPYIDGGISLISDKLRLYLVCAEKIQPAVVRTYRTRATCILCHKDTCPHVKALNGSSHLDLQSEEMDGEGEGTVVIQWKDVASTRCDHAQPLHRKTRECTVVDDRGVLSKTLVTIETSVCCKNIIYPSSVFCLSEGMILNTSLLKFYESMLAKAAMTLSGYWRSLVDYGLEMGRSQEEILSLSSLSRAWNAYLARLHIPDHKFGCDQCGKYPRALVFDGIQLGIRSSVANEKEIPKGKYTFIESPLPYLGKLQENM
ncbi:hypothetical protein PMAYCL1PPCAC_31718, partial [Pristionchus mayeri]